jgi:hypothetical protein
MNVYQELVFFGSTCFSTVFFGAAFLVAVGFFLTGASPFSYARHMIGERRITSKFPARRPWQLPQVHQMHQKYFLPPFSIV